ncbi:cryptochrome/photolyase family protein [Luteipulveratus halotolerans]|uniref:Deoxyribodipyrimidine photolyase n=1 Tax=Luteipulveratus halotolerans TaxID=1631356 RepID=A0A0L6CGH2_9MICO|nr:deoxyribodipyrimidine photo-lyase [Luteipulveratus halotolerans]KNX36814.1 deoxyribodipyrimidine photolyase [Luteipulveratus halotolerans]
MVRPTILWLRRDLRLHDHPALLAAHEEAGSGGVLPLFVVEPGLWDGAGEVRRRWLAQSLQALAASYDHRLVLRYGDPASVVPAVAAEVDARAVHVTRESTPHGRRRDAAVERALGDVPLRATGTPYAVAPGRVLKGDGTPYAVFTPFARAWHDHGWPGPADAPRRIRWAASDSDDQAVTAVSDAADGEQLVQPGEDAALGRWDDFVEEAVAAYDTDRDRAAVDGTSRISPYLKLGVVHPRTLLQRIAHLRSNGAATMRTELAWREFYADVLWHHPRSAWHDLRPALTGMDYDEPGDLVDAWKAGRTGYPFVDAGMRQLLATGWMHNRVRMVTASFLTKDLHVWWPIGARHFLDHLVDGDLASNNHGWQWVSGTGTDAAPYFRVFNPVTQGERFDPDGDYVRRWVPELRHLDGKAVHQPWKHADGHAHGYPERVVDHAEERREALRRYEAVR